MTRIGFAYNEKPEPADAEIAIAGEPVLPEDEPPSSRRDAWSRTSTAAAPSAAVISASPPVDDEYAEGDSPETTESVQCR